MRLSVLGAFCQTRLSFMRTLLRHIHVAGWTFARTRWQMDKRGEGFAVYEARTGTRIYSLLVFAHNIPPSQRSDRVIAEVWDATFTLVDGTLTMRDIRAMQKSVPLQEAGRNSSRQLVLSRANRSVRTFDATVQALAAGRQPTSEIAAGYLMRTTAVYGNGKFGIGDRRCIALRAEFAAPFAPEMLAVFMFRAFPPDLAEHLAATKSKHAVCIAPQLRRLLGIGNSTGLGMAPFLVNHPLLLHRWILARETALARVLAQRGGTSRSGGGEGKTVRDIAKEILRLIKQAQGQHWQTRDVGQKIKIAQRKKDLQQLQKHCSGSAWYRGVYPWRRLYNWGERHLSVEGCELLVSLLLEPHGGLVDSLAPSMSGDETFNLDGGQSVGALRRLLMKHYRWALDDSDKNESRFWYVSAEKMEPRVGFRDAEPGAELELPMSIARDVRALLADLSAFASTTKLYLFLLRHPQHRYMARRVQMAARFPYSEIRECLLSRHMLPLDMLRCKLSFFGAAKFDPKSDLWLRINMFQHAPYPQELPVAAADDWAWRADAA